MMSKLDADGKIHIPKKLLEKFHLEPNDEIEMQELPEGILVAQKKAHREMIPDVNKKINDFKTRMLSLNPNWDGEGAIPIEESTWNRMEHFLLALMQKYYTHYDHLLDMPYILPGVDGSIDLHWKKPDFELLVNIPANSKAQACFYGDTFTGNEYEASVDLDQLERVLLPWLALIIQLK